LALAELQPPGQVVCGGMSYTAHNDELKDLIRIPDEIKGMPFFFIKAQRALSKHGAPIVLPDIRPLVRKKFDAPWGQVTGEVELGIVLKDRTWRIKPEEASKHILGYTVFNDVSQRDLQLVGYPVSMTKGFHSFGPLGPHMVPADEIPDPQKLGFELRVNGKAQQKGSLSEMLFSIETLISLASQIFMLERGDVITTGSPPGMFAYGLKPGDVIEAEIERVGVLRNPVIQF
jgi:2-keto-4-pentenoate hydratase/2-oxohepta-3-ene-1,7-dioic acid hydratase in catechol pathway